MVFVGFRIEYFVVWCALLTGIFLIHSTASEGDCMYNKCEYKFGGFGFHEPCLGTGGRSLVRNVECLDGNTIHICCSQLNRPEIQQSRQNWFRFVTLAGNQISQGCTMRVLCEQSCKDGLNGLARSTYPEVLNDDTEENRKYVEAYTQGESYSCYGESKSATPKETGNEQSYDALTCEADCQQKYSECDKDLDDSYMAKAYYEGARPFHKLGLWLFSAMWASRDTFDEGKQKAVDTFHTVKKAFSRLLDRMLGLDERFKEWKSDEVENRRKKRSTAAEDDEQKWKEYLVIYNRTDADLVEILYGSLTYVEFGVALGNINETLCIYFGPGEWVENGVRGVHHRYQVSENLGFYVVIAVFTKILNAWVKLV